jgi:hypothetical protein
MKGSREEGEKRERNQNVKKRHTKKRNHKEATTIYNTQEDKTSSTAWAL